MSFAWWGPKEKSKNFVLAGLDKGLGKLVAQPPTLKLVEGAQNAPISLDIAKRKPAIRGTAFVSNTLMNLLVGGRPMQAMLICSGQAGGSCFDVQLIQLSEAYPCNGLEERLRQNLPIPEQPYFSQGLDAPMRIHRRVFKK